MSETQAIVFASENEGKIRELNALLTPLGYTVSSQKDHGIVSLPETAVTFVENAIVKARHASSKSGLAAIADDSGLEVDALKGAPGLYSSRYAKMNNTGSGDVDNYMYLLKQLDGLDESARTARFRSVVVYLRHENDPSPIISEGVWEGHILPQAVEGGGFGYDPVFCNHDTNEAASLLEKNLKNRLSHRGKAVASLVKQLESRTTNAGA